VDPLPPWDGWGCRSVVTKQEYAFSGGELRARASHAGLGACHRRRESSCGPGLEGARRVFGLRLPRRPGRRCGGRFPTAGRVPGGC